ncbi:MAG TPA: RnfABCDGE type electron transport complex subunit B [Gammaproteobacteria bacterium]|mgnify:CR=1 FL=1|nr:RnfABCDGE type electron transport complex subunit B [Gammaproteobacteria bacterium]
MQATTAADALRARILALLPHTECGACGQPGCAPYAAALAAGSASPEACTPGGALLAQRLRRLLDRPRAPTLAEFLAPLPTPQLARIRAADCIGCTRCLAPCPTDAILGARRQLHGVLEADCTGCGLCLPPCPVDCIELEEGDDAPAATPPAVREALAYGPEITACTACGQCAPACPEGLDPRRLAQALRALDLESAQALGLARCTECAACDAACPPRIPLAAHFTHGKTLALADAAAATRAAHAAERQRAAAQRRAASPVAHSVALVAPPPDRADAAAGVAAALARARARRGA